jgi:hypothetical protein
MRHVAHEEAAQTKPISTISLIARLGAVERVPRTNFPGALAATQAMEVMKAIFLPGLNEKAIIARWRDAPGAHTMVNGGGRSTMTKHADSIDAPQRALAAPKSTGMRRHRRKAEIRQQVVQESQNGERRTITTMPATDVPTGMNLSTMTFGVDIGDKKRNYCLLDPEGRIVREGSFNTTRGGVMKTFADLPRPYRFRSQCAFRLDERTSRQSGPRSDRSPTRARSGQFTPALGRMTGWMHVSWHDWLALTPS